MMKKTPPHTLPRSVILTALAVGVISALAFRSLLILSQLFPELVTPVWYMAVIGYLMFFLYRYMISRKRRRAIEEYELIEKIQAGVCPIGQDREVLLYILNSIKLSREHINYYIIFILSLVAIAADLIIRFAI